MVCCAIAIFMLSQIYAASAWLARRLRLRAPARRTGSTAASAWIYGGGAADSRHRPTNRSFHRMATAVGALFVVLAAGYSLTSRLISPDLGPLCGHGWTALIRNFWTGY